MRVGHFGRLATPHEFLGTLAVNGWVFLQTVLWAYPGCDPDQEGSYQWTARDRRSWPALVLILPLVFYVSGFWPVLLWLLSPWLLSAFCELGNARDRSPRVWLPRWYIGSLGIVMLFAGFPAWARWPMLVLWGLLALHLAHCYRSEIVFYETVKAENPNRSHYRIAGLPFLYAREGQQYRAECECAEVLKADPDNFKVSLILELFRRNRAWTDAGCIGVGFICAFCKGQSARLLKDGDRLTRQEHDMYFFRVCAFCGAKTDVLSLGI